MLEQLSSPAFWVAVGQIILIDLLLGGDNAVVIALACRNLPPNLRRKGILWGVAGAIGLRVVLTFFALSLLELPFLRMIGAALLLWIGIKLILPEDDNGHEIEGSQHLIGAIKTIIVADFVMSLDNVVGVAGAAKGSFALIVFGLIVSIPIIVFGSQVILRLIDRFPIVIVFGGALLGWIAGELAVTDPIVKPYTEPYGKPLYYGAAVIGAGLVVVIGKWLARRRPAKAAVIDLATDNALDKTKSL